MTMRTTAAAWAVALAVALGPAPGAADEWDTATDGDGDVTTDNVLYHGSEQVHALSTVPVGGIDEDWYFVLSRQYSSYEVRVDGMTGDLDLTSGDVQRMREDGTQALQNALVTDNGGVLSLAWTHGQGLAGATSFIKVHGATCSPSCAGLRATYRIRFYDSTYTVPRFENSDEQQTTLIVQNVIDRACQAFYTFIGDDGAVLHNQGPVTLPARGLSVFRTGIVVPGASGSIRIAHTCGYGGLSGKAVAVEPSTGFTFDTALAHRPH